MLQGLFAWFGREGTCPVDRPLPGVIVHDLLMKEVLGPQFLRQLTVKELFLKKPQISFLLLPKEQP